MSSIPPAPDRTAARKTLGLAPDARVALFLGRLDTRQKGLDTLADAIRRNAGRLDGWTFLMIGAGDGGAMLDGLGSELAGRVDIRRMDWVDAPHAMLAAADLLLMPSRWEGVPLVMLEAIAYGLPILGSDIDVFRDYLPDANRIDFARDDFAAALDRVIQPGAVAAYRACAEQRRAGIDLASSGRRFVDALIPETALEMGSA